MTNPYEAPLAAPPPVNEHDAARRDAAWALALGIASLVMCAPLTAPLAMWKASRALRVRPSGEATVGIVLAALGLLSSAVLWFLAIWQFLTPAAPRPS